MQVELGTEPVGVEQGSESVKVVLKKVSQDGTESSEEVEVAYVVGADGARGMC